ncbi:retrovirus-related Pol polyprotein from transposon 412 [Trichonephila clavipes]|nr:retrovirus-related Pol polyprotein from transposon 412 [Trichonephila clavipes]
MQISAENLQDDLDLRHVEDRQIKKELEKLIQDYKPEKTASTDVIMRIILKDEEPVCQPPRLLAFTERQEVNKQIEEWLNEGIIRPSSAEYASPIVMVKKKDGSSRMCIDYTEIELEACERQISVTSHRKCFGHFARRKGQHFKIVTDCSAFQKTMQKKDLIICIARWTPQLEEVDYEIEHRAGSRMKHVDAVS